MEASALPARSGLAQRVSLAGPLLRLRSDEQLVELFRAGHEEAFGAIHDRYRQRLFAYTRQMLYGSRHDAEDALQDIFVRAYSGLRAGNGELALRAWLYRVAHNRCVDELRRPAPPPAEVLELLRGPIDDPTAAAEQRESLQRLVTDVRRLPEQQRSALLMRELAGMTYADVSCALGVSVPAVKSLLVRARVGLTRSSEARDADCAQIRSELTAAHDRGDRANAVVRRHLRDCGECRRFGYEVREVSRRLAALTPMLGPLGFMAKLGFGTGAGGGAGGSGAAGVGGAGGSGAAGVSGAGLSGAAGVSGAGAAGAAAGGGAITGGAAGTAAASVGIIATGAGHVAPLLAAAAVAAGGAAEIQHVLSQPVTIHRAAAVFVPLLRPAAPRWHAAQSSAAHHAESPNPQLLIDGNRPDTQPLRTDGSALTPRLPGAGAPGRRHRTQVSTISPRPVTASAPTSVTSSTATSPTTLTTTSTTTRPPLGGGVIGGGVIGGGVIGSGGVIGGGVIGSGGVIGADSDQPPVSGLSSPSAGVGADLGCAGPPAGYKPPISNSGQPGSAPMATSGSATTAAGSSSAAPRGGCPSDTSVP